MTDTDDTPPPPTDAERRRQRQAEALRANLARRKARDRARATEECDVAATGLHGAETDATTGG